MRRDPDDPFEEIFRQLERFMDDVMQQGGWSFDPAGGVQEATGPGTHVDVQEYDDRVTVIADLPGVEKEDIDLTCDGDVLTIRAQRGDRHYDERVRLPAAVDEASARAKYNNGVLEVRFDRVEGASSIDVE